MPNSLRLWYCLPGRIMLLVMMLLVGIAFEAQATHIRAGDITARKDTGPNPNPRKLFFTMIIYNKDSSTAEDPSVTVSMGDGNTVTVDWQRRPPLVKPDINRAVYQWEYTYAANGTYIVSWVGENRNNGIKNLAAPSELLSFAITTTISLSPLRALNSTPVLQVPPIDDATIGQRWVHNPGAWDEDGDSLSFRLVQPQHRNTTTGRITNVPGYSDPNLIGTCRNAANTGGPTFTLNQITGQITWDAPCVVGEYNIAFVVEEWRVTGGAPVLLSTTLRDMQINVVDNPNKPPVLTPIDTCIVAGERLRTTITARDPDNDIINLTVPGTGGILPPATFNVTVRQPGRSAGTLIWNTTCNDVQARPYQLVFKAEDTLLIAGRRQLADLQPYRITVVGPPPQNLQAAGAENRSVRLTWDLYTCQNASTIRIYRREGPSNWRPGPCETGVPASTGYVMIGEVEKGATEFVDNNNGQGLVAGQEYCYVIYAEFPRPRGGQSIASVEACVVIDRDIPYLTNVTVDRTATTNGQITVKWTEPGEGVELLNPPFEYRLFRKTGQEEAGNYQQVFTSNNLAATEFVDTGLNTEQNAYRYRLEFYSSPVRGGTPTVPIESTSASSVRLAATAVSTQAEKAVTLTWNYSVPWRNDVLNHQVYRVVDGNLVEIGNVAGGPGSATFTDTGAGANPLERGNTYCYVVRTQGTYQIEGLPEPLLNFSQQVCVELPRIVCAPELTINALDCEAFFANPTQPPYQNVLNWVPQITGDCTDEIDFYTVYFKGPGEADYRQLTTTKETTFTHTGLESFAGCYYVTATSTAGVESPPSNEVCKDNCFFFQLPNIITPNADGKNDVFRPDPRAAFIRSTNFKVFNRWGVKVYESNGDPYINWPGTDSKGNRLTDGVYYYEAEVEFISIDPERARSKYKGWVELVR